MIIPILIPLLVGMFLALNMGGSGTAPSFSAAYGTNIIKKLAIPGLFGIFVFLGAIIAGEKVVLTLGKGLLDASKMTLTVTTIILISVSLSLLFANLIGVPQSTSQSTVLALCGPAMYLDSLNTHKLFIEIIPIWFLLPVIAFLLTLLVARFLKPFLEKEKATDYSTLKKYSFVRLFLIGSACYVAFSIGSNNVANATGPLISMVIKELHIDPNDHSRFVLVMVIATLMIAPLFGIGSSVFGYKVMKSAGRDIVQVGPLEASIISVITATLLLAASLTKGIPTSLVQLNSLAFMAIGVNKMGWRNTFRNSTVRKFWVVWLVAPVFALALAFILTYLADIAGLLYH
jgi:sulfate permease